MRGSASRPPVDDGGFSARLELARAALAEERDPKGIACPSCSRPMLSKLRRDSDRELAMVISEFWSFGIGCIGAAALAVVFTGVALLTISLLADGGPDLGLAVGLTGVGLLAYALFVVVALVKYRDKVVYQCVACGEVVKLRDEQGGGGAR